MRKLFEKSFALLALAAILLSFGGTKTVIAGMDANCPHDGGYYNVSTPQVPEYRTHQFTYGGYLYSCRIRVDCMHIAIMCKKCRSVVGEYDTVEETHENPMCSGIE